MFNMRVTSYLLISLILFQSFSAVANSLDFHTITSQHLNEVHENQLVDNAASEKTKIHIKLNVQAETSTADILHNPVDCHHCGHCHGTHAQWLGNTNSIELDSVTTYHGYYYLSKVIDTPVTQLLRPPKALS